jgi:hypothetical protein
MEAVSGAGQSGDGRWLASCWFSTVLELDLEGEKTGGQEKTVASSGADLPYDGEEPDLSARFAFTANCSCWASRYPSEASPAG